jgi:predicted CXXCH cytochrome family protein
MTRPSGIQRAAVIPVVAALALVAAMAGAPRSAGVHAGGVGSCSTCHVMHQNQGGGPAMGNPLLVVDNASDLCLSCHATNYGSVMGADPLVPPLELGAGNFVFLIEDNIHDGINGLVNPIAGDAAGHNVSAPGSGLSTDPRYPTSPGGHFPSSQMSCTSCHDPHGNTNYRFLYGAGQGPSQGSGPGWNFVNPAPDAVGLNVVVGAPETNSNHVAYRGGMSRWCGNCHPDYLSDHGPASAFTHPVDRPLEDSNVNRYNIYNGTADPAGGSPLTAYLAAVPFEDASSTVGGTNGPSTSSRLMCLSCHRAHASSAPASGRWDFNVGTLGQDGSISGSYPIPNPYVDPNQTQLCYKCHGK